MVFDLRRALLRKEETESARLADFDFRLRARTMRLLAADLGLSAPELVGALARADDAAIVAELDVTGPASVQAACDRCQAAARRALITERGDPTPHRLA